MQNERSQMWMSVAGIALVVGFFMPWIDILGLGSVSGWDLVRQEHISSSTRLIIAMCPILGIALSLAALTKSKRAALVSLIAGAGVLGYTSFKVVYIFAKVTGWGLWLVLAAGLVALVLGLAHNKKSTL